MPVNLYDQKEIIKHALNAINASNVTDAEVAPMTDADELAALFTGRASGEWLQRQDMEFHHQSILAAIAAEIFTDANVAAANTVAGLRTVLTTAWAAAGGVAADLPSTYQSGNRQWS
jgi:hypothetical protein